MREDALSAHSRALLEYDVAERAGNEIRSRFWRDVAREISDRESGNCVDPAGADIDTQDLMRAANDNPNADT